MNAEASGNKYKEALSLYTPTILKDGKLLTVKGQLLSFQII